MNGFLLTETKLKDIPDAGNKSWNEIEQEYPILRQEGEYLRRILP